MNTTTHQERVERIARNTRQSRIDRYRQARDAYLQAKREWLDNSGNNGQSWEGRRRKNASEMRDWMSLRIKVLRDLENINAADIDRRDGITVN